MKKKVDLLASWQLKYASHINLTLEKTEEYLVRPLTDIWIYPESPHAFEAVFGGMDPDGSAVHILAYRNGEWTHDVRECRGFRKNGTMIYS